MFRRRRRRASGRAPRPSAVDDGSADDTGGTVEELARGDPRLVLVRNPCPHGYGRAVALVLAACSGDAVAVVMADPRA